MEENIGINILVSGEIYWTDTPGTYIFRYISETKTFQHYIAFSSDSIQYSQSTGTHKWNTKRVRRATEEEKIWFEECDKVGKLVKRSEVVKPLIKVSYTTNDGEIKTEIIEWPVSNASKLEGFKELNYYITL